MARTAINLYSVRDLDEPMLDIIDRVAAAGFDGVQFSGGLRDATPDDVAARVEQRGLGVTPVHVDIEHLEGDLEETVAVYRDVLGTDGVVVSWLGDDHFRSREAVDETARRLATLADEYGEEGLSLHYHNHAHEFVDLGGENAFERLIHQTPAEVCIELDVGWALVGGVDPVELIETYGDRMTVLHMKDMVTTEDAGFREIGEGDVDVQACADAGRDVGVEWLIYEYDEPSDPAGSIDVGGAFLRSL